MIDRFMEAVERLDKLSLLERHRTHRNAKILRRRIEAGEEPTDADWEELFPHPHVCQLARIKLGERLDPLDYDHEATWVGANAKAAREIEAVVAEARKRSA
ncbi:MAG: hypothetical protein AAF533_28195 [Acidobacteriota bacterium]